MGKTMDRSCEDYSHIYRTFLTRGHAGLTDTEARAISISANGTALVPTTWANYVQNTIAQDSLLSKVNVVHSTSPFVLPIVTTDATANITVAEGALGTESSVVVTKPYGGLTGTTTYTFGLKKITAWTKVSNELLEDSEAAQSVEELLKRQLTARIATILNRQIITGSGAASTTGTAIECQGSFHSARMYGRFASSTSSFSAANHAISMLKSLIGTTDGTLPAVSFESFSRMTVVLNTRVLDTIASTGNIPAALASSHPDHLTLLGRPVMFTHLENGAAATGSTFMHLLDPTQYLLAMNPEGISVARFSETLADADQTIFAATVRADGSIMNTQAVWNINAA